MTSTHRMLVIGGDCTIGSRLRELLAEAGHEVIHTTRRERQETPRRRFLDLSQDVENWPIPPGVTAAFLAAGATSLEHCRQHPQESARVNVTGTFALARRLCHQGAFVVYPSSNLVFDGESPHCPPDRPRTPRCEYGRQKAELERRLATLGDASAVIRFTKILTDSFPLFDRWSAALRRGERIQPFHDLCMAPVPLDFAGEVLIRTAQERRPGIWQVSGEVDVSYAEIAARLVDRLAASPTQLEAISALASGKYHEPIPRFTTLQVDRLQSELGLQPPPVWTTLEAVLARACQAA